jgi:hypothetical protein
VDGAGQAAIIEGVSYSLQEGCTVNAYVLALAAAMLPPTAAWIEGPPDGDAASVGQPAGAGSVVNLVYQRLVESGVSLPDGRSVKLPEPVLRVGMDAAAEQAALRKLERPGKSLKELMRATIPAPFLLDISQVPDSRARRVDLYFFARGELETLLDKDFLENQLGFTGKRDKNDDEWNKSGFLAAEELAARQLTALESEEAREAYLYSTSNVFDRVLLSSTSRVFQTRHERSIVAASLLDERFDGDEQYPNQWRPLVRDAAGRLKLGKGVHRYAGLGSYIKVTALAGQQGLLFIEFHMVFDEPQEWFGGANYISSKLPPLMQDNVRQFRARLAKARSSAAKRGG